MKALFYLLAIAFGALAIGQINLGSTIWAVGLLSLSALSFYVTSKFEDHDF